MQKSLDSILSIGQKQT